MYRYDTENSIRKTNVPPNTYLKYSLSCVENEQLILYLVLIN